VSVRYFRRFIEVYRCAHWRFVFRSHYEKKQLSALLYPALCRALYHISTDIEVRANLFYMFHEVCFCLTTITEWRPR
jgi:hypothetical protein